MASELRTVFRKTLRLSSNLERPWICRSCSSKNFPLLDRTPNSHSKLTRHIPSPRLFSTTSLRFTPDPEPPHSPPPPPPLPTTKIDDLPSKQESQRSHLSKRFDTLMDNLQSNIFVAGQRINDLTGYSGIEALKKAIELQESALSTRRSALQDAKTAYTSAINTRSASQREVNELLQRKNSWSATDVERFTSLYRSDHENELREAQAAQDVADAERASEEASTKLAGSILARYHEEQIWSDKIRRMSTWGTWGLMGVNVLLFLIFQVAVEPWRRRRLVAGFESKVVEALEKEGALTREGFSVAAGEITRQGGATVTAVGNGLVEGDGAEQMRVEREIEAVVNDEIDSELKVYQTQTAEESVEEPTSFTFSGEIDVRQYLDVARRQIATYFSEKTILVRQVDLTAATLEGMFIGVVVSGVIASLIRGR